MASKKSSGFLKDNIGGIPLWVWLGALATLIAFFYRRGSSNSSTTASTATSVFASNSPTATVTNMGHTVNQGLPIGQVTPNSPGTAPIFNDTGAPQYGGS
jgi:hypothetical protein